MIPFNKFSIRILLTSLLFISINLHADTGQTSLTQLHATTTNASVVLERPCETDVGIYYEAILKDDENNKELGRVSFSYNKLTQTGYIAKLHVPREERKNSYGSQLLKYALQKLTFLRCIGIYWQAFPFDLFDGQTAESMLPKLIAFYKRHGAQVLNQTPISAQMAYYPNFNSRLI